MPREKEPHIAEEYNQTQAHTKGHDFDVDIVF